VKLQVAGTNLSATTGADGAFIIPDTPEGALTVEGDPDQGRVNPPMPKIALKAVSLKNRDNPMPNIKMQQPSGVSVVVGDQSGFAGAEFGRASASAPNGKVETWKRAG
jgi:hypothetical protein